LLSDPGIWIILFSGRAANGDLLEEARKQGHGFESLPKPIRPEALIQLVRRTSRQA
jgi:hypothetical protein